MSSRINTQLPQEDNSSLLEQQQKAMLKKNSIEHSSSSRIYSSEDSIKITKKKPTQTGFALRLDIEDLEYLKKVANMKERSVNYILNVIIKDFVKKNREF